MTNKKNGTKKGVRYLGGYVPKPKLGIHLNAISYDVSSMYPTMIDRHNISTDTINCECCRNNPEARVSDEIMSEINGYLTGNNSKAKKKEPRPWHYWICQKKRGKLADVMESLRAKKIEFKKSGPSQRLKEKAIKILMNSGYGCFGAPYFEYQDPRVAELTTAFGRYTLKHLEKFVGEDNMLYGDTDSIYVASEAENDAIISEASKFGVRLEIDKRWRVLCLNTNKKQYFGITESGKLEHTTLPGMKNNQPAYFSRVTQKLISKEFQELFIPSSSSSDADGNGDCNRGNQQQYPLHAVSGYLRHAFAQLESCNLDELSFSKKATKPLYEYEHNDEHRQIYDENLEDCGGNEEMAQLKSQGNCVYKFWKVKAEKRPVSMHPEKYELNMEKYREGLFSCAAPILRAYGMSEEEESRLQEQLTGQRPKRKSKRRADQQQQQTAID
jgi:DNA polymerase elongation subunit (family B)